MTADAGRDVGRELGSSELSAVGLPEARCLLHDRRRTNDVRRGRLLADGDWLAAARATLRGDLLGTRLGSEGELPRARAEREGLETPARCNVRACLEVLEVWRLASGTFPYNAASLGAVLPPCLLAPQEDGCLGISRARFHV